MSPMLVYFLMMADDIKATAGWLAVLLGIAAAITTAFYIAMNGWVASETKKVMRWPDSRDQAADLEEATMMKALATRLLRWLGTLFFVTLSINTFAPGTKTIAAMVVLPKITSPQALDAMGNEAKELYGLAKDALRNLAGDDKPAKSDK